MKDRIRSVKMKKWEEKSVIVPLLRLVMKRNVNEIAKIVRDLERRRKQIYSVACDLFVLSPDDARFRLKTWKWWILMSGWRAMYFFCNPSFCDYFAFDPFARIIILPLNSKIQFSIQKYSMQLCNETRKDMSYIKLINYDMSYKNFIIYDISSTWRNKTDIPYTFHSRRKQQSFLGQKYKRNVSKMIIIRHLHIETVYNILYYFYSLIKLHW